MYELFQCKVENDNWKYEEKQRLDEPLKNFQPIYEIPQCCAWTLVVIWFHIVKV